EGDACVAPMARLLVRPFTAPRRAPVRMKQRPPARAPTASAWIRRTSRIQRKLRAPPRAPPPAPGPEAAICSIREPAGRIAPLAEERTCGRCTAPAAPAKAPTAKPTIAWTRSHDIAGTWGDRIFGLTSEPINESRARLLRIRARRTAPITTPARAPQIAWVRTPADVGLCGQPAMTPARAASEPVVRTKSET